MNRCRKFLIDKEIAGLPFCPRLLEHLGNGRIRNIALRGDYFFSSEEMYELCQISRVTVIEQRALGGGWER